MRFEFFRFRETRSDSILFESRANSLACAQIPVTIRSDHFALTQKIFANKSDQPLFTTFKMAPLLDEDAMQPRYYHRVPLFPQQPKRKVVSFSHMSNLYFIPHANDLNKREKDATYMTPQDFLRIRQENRCTLEEMNQGQIPNNSTGTYFRGLENLMPQAKEKRKQRISFVVTAVLKEQEKNHRLDPRWVEKFHHSYTSKSAEAAYKKGVWDAAEAHRSEASSAYRDQLWI